MEIFLISSQVEKKKISPEYSDIQIGSSFFSPFLP